MNNLLTRVFSTVRSAVLVVAALAAFLSTSPMVLAASQLSQNSEQEVNYSEHPKALQFVNKMVEQHGFERDYVQGLMNNALRKQSILDAIARPAERTLQWKKYRTIFVTETRAAQGRVFMAEQAVALARAERDFGVPKEIIAAVIGVETRYGHFKGRYRVLDALTTLGFDYPPRARFFSKQLEHYLLLVREQGFDATTVKGSYAGAMGFGQFIPSSYRDFAIDFDGDGVADIVDNITDAIGSVANYFKAHGWRPDERVVSGATVTADYNATLANKTLKPSFTPTQLQDLGYRPTAPLAADALSALFRLEGAQGTEHWLGLQNFYVITRYNHSRLYAMAVYQLSEALR